MLYVIYELVASSSLGKLEDDEDLLVLKQFRRRGMDEVHHSFELAFKEIENHKEELHNMDFVILPTVGVDYEGNIEGNIV